MIVMWHIVVCFSLQNGDYSFDNLKDVNTEGFNVDNPKVSNCK
jgi:hypothetical protein